MERGEFYTSLWGIFKKCTEKATSHFSVWEAGEDPTSATLDTILHGRMPDVNISEDPRGEAFTAPSLDMSRSGEAFMMLGHEVSQVLLTAYIHSPPLCSWMWTGWVWGLSHGGCQRQSLRTVFAVHLFTKPPQVLKLLKFIIRKLLT